jgi:hypothetical protein
MRVGGNVALDEVSRVGDVLPHTAGDGALGERAKKRDMDSQIRHEMLETLVLAGIVQLVPALERKQPCVIVRGHLDCASPSCQVDLGHLRPCQFLWVEDRLGRSVELAGEAVTELDACNVWPCRKRTHLRSGDVR